MTIADIQSLSLRDIVTRNFHAAAVLEKYSLDYCCHGAVNIDVACRERMIDINQLLCDLAALDQGNDAAGMRFAEWEPDFLINYILQNHHSYVSKMIPVLYAHTQKIAVVHGDRHPELPDIFRRFETVALELKRHMMKEEEILFPYIIEMTTAKKEQRPRRKPHFGSVRNPITMMEAEHLLAGDEMASIRLLSDQYKIPDDACTTYRITYQELHDFERDLHRHIHLENNILFPKALELERDINEER